MSVDSDFEESVSDVEVSDDRLRINEVFYSLQDERTLAGVPSMFVRT